MSDLCYFLHRDVVKKAAVSIETGVPDTRVVGLFHLIRLTSDYPK